MGRITRRAILKAGAAVSALALAPRLGVAKQRVILNDASRLNPTPVFRHWIVPTNEEAGFIESLRAELKDAAVAKRPVALSAARHSMGGQSLPRNGTAITLSVNRCEPDIVAKTYRVSAGTRWHQVIAKLDAIGFSPAVMQSNNDFGVASTFSVNAHGWPVPFGPFGSTVRALKMMLADGSVVTCSRTENADLFKLAMGGYGLIGAILELDVDMVENILVEPKYQVLPATDFSTRFVAAATAPATRMAYGRLAVAKSQFFEEGLIVSYQPAPPGAGPVPKAGAGGFATALSRKIYRAQVGSEVGKRARWLAETVVGPKLAAGAVSRNTLLNEVVANLAGSDPARTDILHEYFIPPARFGDFVALCRKLIPNSHQELLNITLRYVAADTASVMAFAPTPRIAGVMSFAQQTTPEAEADMIELTESLIEGVGGLGGSFYLPYRLHARPDQVRAIYQHTDEFIAGKRRYDPNLLFRNAIWPAYFATDG